MSKGSKDYVIFKQGIKAMCEMMSKGSKEALAVLIVTYVTHV